MTWQGAARDRKLVAELGPRTATETRSRRPSFAAAERIIQLVEDAESFVDGSARRERSESRLRVMLRDGDGAQLFHELVDAHGALSRESLHSCVCVVGETDGQCGHGWCSAISAAGVTMCNSGKRISVRWKSRVLWVTMAPAFPATASSTR